MHRRAQRASTAFTGRYLRTILISSFFLAAGNSLSQTPAPAWHGILENEAAQHIARARVKVDAGDEHKATVTNQDGVFLFEYLLPKTYHVAVDVNGRVYRSSADIKIPAQAATVMTQNPKTSPL